MLPAPWAVAVGPRALVVSWLRDHERRRGAVNGAGDGADERELESCFRPKITSPTKFHAAGFRLGGPTAGGLVLWLSDAVECTGHSSARNGKLGMLRAAAPRLRNADFPEICCWGDNLSFSWTRAGQLSFARARIEFGFSGFATRSPSIATQVDSHPIGTSPPSRIPPPFSLNTPRHQLCQLCLFTRHVGACCCQNPSAA